MIYQGVFVRRRLPPDTVVTRGVGVYRHPVTGAEIRQPFCFYDSPDLDHTVEFVANSGVEQHLDYVRIEWESVHDLFTEEDGDQEYFTIH